MYGTNNLIAHQSLVPATRTATGNGTGIRVGKCTHVIVLLNVGTVTGTSPTLDVTLQTSTAVGGTYAAVTGAAFTQVTATPSTATDVAVGIFAVNGQNQFLRAVATIGGTSPSFPSCVSFIGINVEDTAEAFAVASGFGKINFSV